MNINLRIKASILPPTLDHARLFQLQIALAELIIATLD